MMRVCHLDTCPVGVATQNPQLRARFSGKPEFVVNFFEFIAKEVREYLARLAFARLEEIIGRVDLLDSVLAVEHCKASRLDLSPILFQPPLPDDSALSCVTARITGWTRRWTTRSSSSPRARSRRAAEVSVVRSSRPPSTPLTRLLKALGKGPLTSLPRIDKAGPLKATVGAAARALTSTSHRMYPAIN
jgi:Conserved region in glutamate synthase